jgi:methanogenic corrinoid protein MtbC1
MTPKHRSTVHLIRARQHVLAERVVARLYGARPAQGAASQEKARARSVREAGDHLTYLAEAVDVPDDSLFVAYVAWAQSYLEGLGLDERALVRTLQAIEQVLATELTPEQMSHLRPTLRAGLGQARSKPSMPPSHLADGAPLASLARAYLDALLAGDRRAASRLILDAAQAGTPVQDLYLHVFQPVQREVGRLWQINRLSIAQEHYVTAATQLVMSQLYPRIFSTERVGRCLVATCVGGELHEIGVRMVADLFEMAGWDSYYLGANTPVQGVLQALEERQPDVLAISATLTVHVGQVRAMIEQVRATNPSEGATDSFRPLVLVGGYPFLLSAGLWRRVGADGFAPDARQAVEVAGQLVSQRDALGQGALGQGALSQGVAGREARA